MYLGFIDLWFGIQGGCQAKLVVFVGNLEMNCSDCSSPFCLNEMETKDVSANKRDNVSFTVDVRNDNDKYLTPMKMQEYFCQ